MGRSIERHRALARAATVRGRLQTHPHQAKLLGIPAIRAAPALRFRAPTLHPPFDPGALTHQQSDWHHASLIPPALGTRAPILPLAALPPTTLAPIQGHQMLPRAASSAQNYSKCTSRHHGAILRQPTGEPIERRPLQGVRPGSGGPNCRNVFSNNVLRWTANVRERSLPAGTLDAGPPKGPHHPQPARR